MTGRLRPDEGTVTPPADRDLNGLLSLSSAVAA